MSSMWIYSNKYKQISRTISHGPVLQCTKCEYYTKTKSHLEKHIDTTHENGQIGFKCSDCIFFTKNRQTLNRHIPSTHSKSTSMKLSAIHKNAASHKKGQ